MGIKTEESKKRSNGSKNQRAEAGTGRKTMEAQGEGRTGAGREMGSPKGAMVRHTAQEEVPPRDAGVLLGVRVGIGEGTVMNL